MDVLAKLLQEPDAAVVIRPDGTIEPKAPTIGRMVHFVNPADGSHEPAVVTYVYEVGVAAVVGAVDLSVMGRYRFGHEHDVALDQESRREAPGTGPSVNDQQNARSRIREGMARCANVRHT